MVTGLSGVKRNREWAIEIRIMHNGDKYDSGDDVISVVETWEESPRPDEEVYELVVRVRTFPETWWGLRAEVLRTRGVEEVVCHRIASSNFPGFRGRLLTVAREVPKMVDEELRARNRSFCFPVLPIFSLRHSSRHTRDSISQESRKAASRVDGEAYSRSGPGLPSGRAEVFF